jgi:ribonuclease VapC
MFLDTSAIIEILLDEPRAEEMIARLNTAESQRSTGPVAVYEAAIVLSGKQNLIVADAERLVRSLLQALNIEVATITDDTASAAIDAFSRYGKGRHPAKLNFGDCFSYAGAKMAGVPLLYVGGNFALTDLG